MKTFVKQAAQGDVLISKIDKLPRGCVKVDSQGGPVVVAHSETGHHHVLDREHVTMYRLPEEIYECFVVVGAATALKHLRPFDTHESIMLAPGTYKIKRQREYVPEGFRRVED